MSPRIGSTLAEPDANSAYSHSSIAEPETANIGEGDQVRHKIRDYLNNGLPFQVLATDRYNALCSYMDELSRAPIITWYEKAELVKVVSTTEERYEED